MNLALLLASAAPGGEIRITGSKSESNRLLILQALYPGIGIENLSNSDDTRVLQAALSSQEDTIDVHHAGTAMRFLTAYFASREGKRVVLTGSRRMQERPVRVLVKALRDLGADISYLKNEGFPPVEIRGKALVKREVVVQSNISSQYISALMLIAPSLPEGLVIHLDGNLTSVPYIKMTLKFLSACGIEGSFEKDRIEIPPVGSLPPVQLTVESDWSSASYFYSIAALSPEAKIRLTSYKEFSYQGDRSVVDIYRQLGVETTFEGNGILLHKVPHKKPKSLSLDLADTPDLAQTIAVTCLGLGLKCDLRGLHTLRIKETDRLEALRSEITKLGGRVEITRDSFHLSPGAEPLPGKKIETYNDHRMALAFAPLAVKVPIEIADADVVSKSFPGYWEALEGLGFSVNIL